MMGKTVYNKLVRDKIPNIISAQGKTASVSVLSPSDFEEQLKRKLLEEVHEFLESGETMELVDIYQVILAILEERGISFSAFARLQQQKADLNGEFKRRLFLHFVE